MSKKRYIEKNQHHKAEEPIPSYSIPDKNKPLHVFSSFAEMEDDNYKWLASLTPEQHLQNAVTLIKRIFAEDANKPLGNDLNFD